MFEWFFRTRTFKRMWAAEGGETGIGDDLAAKGFEGIGAWILGRLGGTLDDQYIAASYPFQDPKYAETFRKGLRKARS